MKPVASAHARPARGATDPAGYSSALPEQRGTQPIRIVVDVQTAANGHANHLPGFVRTRPLAAQASKRENRACPASSILQGVQRRGGGQIGGRSAGNQAAAGQSAHVKGHVIAFFQHADHDIHWLMRWIVFCEPLSADTFWPCCGNARRSEWPGRREEGFRGGFLTRKTGSNPGCRAAANAASGCTACSASRRVTRYA